MFGKLPDLFSRNFALAFFVPVAVFLVAVLGLLHAYELMPTGFNLKDVTTMAEGSLLVITTVLTLITWVFGIILLVLNRDLIRFLEGYGDYNPLRVLQLRQERRYRDLQQKIEAYQRKRKQLQTQQQDLSTEEALKYIALREQSNTRFPDDEGLLLPTMLGNTIRAFEVYPKRMYGVDTVGVWNRLAGVMPSEYDALLNDAKAYFDFWLNTILLSIIFIVVYIVLAVLQRALIHYWLPILALLLIPIAYQVELRAAVEWGDAIKAAFDLYLPDLAKKLQLELPLDRKQEWQLWNDVSVAFIYMDQGKLPLRSPPDEED